LARYSDNIPQYYVPVKEYQLSIRPESGFGFSPRSKVSPQPELICTPPYWSSPEVYIGISSFHFDNLIASLMTLMLSFAAQPKDARPATVFPSTSSKYEHDRWQVACASECTTTRSKTNYCVPPTTKKSLEMLQSSSNYNKLKDQAVATTNLTY
jgi:hypothetical protein